MKERDLKFSLRKLKRGTASVLIGMTISALASVSVGAQEIQPSEEAETSESLQVEPASEETSDVTEAPVARSEMSENTEAVTGDVGEGEAPVTLAAEENTPREIIPKSAVVEVTGVDRVTNPFAQEKERLKTS